MNFTVGQLDCISSLKQRLVKAIEDNDGRQDVTIVVNAVELLDMTDQTLDELVSKLSELLCSDYYLVDVEWSRQQNGNVELKTIPGGLLMW